MAIEQNRTTRGRRLQSRWLVPAPQFRQHFQDDARSGCRKEVFALRDDLLREFYFQSLHVRISVTLISKNLWVVPGVPAPATGNFMSITTNLISPTSRKYTYFCTIYGAETTPGGSIKITSSNAFVKPTINPNFLSTAFDIFTLVEAVKAVKRFVAAKAWSGYVIGPFGALANANTDAQIEQYVRGNAATVFHATGTAAMTSKTATWGVVNPDLKVKGVEGLRIVDGSVIVRIFSISCPELYLHLVQPFSPNAHTQGPIYLFAERAADLIKSSR